MVGGQRIRAGLAHARKTVTVTVGPGTIQVAAGTSITVTAARAASRDIRRHKALTTADDRRPAEPGIGR